jgi:hypothetical protein
MRQRVEKMTSFMEIEMFPIIRTRTDGIPRNACIEIFRKSQLVPTRFYEDSTYSQSYIRIPYIGKSPTQGKGQG